MAGARSSVVLVYVLIIGASAYVSTTTNTRSRVSRHEFRGEPSYRATLLAFGDVNLGRTLGRQILREGPDYVFTNFTADTADVVFVNLESTLSDQHGETESPSSNYVFTGPPAGAFALARAGITCAATANNHAFDYGAEALIETIDHLDAANIAHVGTARDAAHVREPLCIERNGIKFAIFAVTDFMNMGARWRRHAASADTALLFPKLREAAASADAVIVSVHGGDEYAEMPSARMISFMRACVTQGARLVLGHHPHVAYGIDTVRGGYIVHSLGNFVFSQPQREWTQTSYGVLFEFSKVGDAVSVALRRLVPIRVGFQPSLIGDEAERARIMARAQKYSTISLKQFN